MKKKMFCIITMPIVIICSLMSLSCEEDIEVIQANDGGDFLAINMATNDTLKITGGLTITIGDRKKLTAYKGNIIKLKFLPNDKYKDYKFETTFTLHNGNEINNPTNYEYEYALSDVELKDYTIRLNASSITQSISASGSFTLQVKE